MKRTFLKFCSLALALVMTLVTFAGTFTFTASAETPTPWDGTTKDTEWASAGANAYYITSAAELAGLAQAAKTNTYSGYTFYITANINLGDKEWTPIGYKNANPFAGSLIGALGHATNVDVDPENDVLQPITITGFSMKNNGTKNQGLVGTLTGPAIKNIIMVEPEINSAVNTTGFIVGYTKTYDGVVLENLAVINGVMNWTGTDAYAGGIAAYCNNKNATFRNCYFNGVINAIGKRVGAIVGCVDDGTLGGNYTFENCQMDGIVNGNNSQAGAFVGRLQGVKLTAKSETTDTSGTKGHTHTEENGVWVDVIETGKNSDWKTRTFEVDLQDIEKATSVTFRKCVLTGVSGQTYGVSRNQAWIGTLAGTTGYSTGLQINFDQTNFTNSKMPLYANADAAVDLVNYVAINSNVVSYTTDAAQYLDNYATLLSATSIDTLNANGTLWQQAAGESPVLKIGAAATRTYAKADLSWFNPVNYKDGFTITTNEQYLGLAMLSQLTKYSKTEYTYAIAKTVDTAAYADKFAAGFLTAIEPLVANKFADEGDLTLKVQVADGATLDAATKLRLVSALDAADVSKYTEVGFVLFVNGTTVAKLGTTTAYKTINGTANGMPVEFNATVFDKTADDYLFTAVIDEIPTDAFETKLDIRVYAIEEDGTVVYGETYYDVTVKALIEALTPAE